MLARALKATAHIALATLLTCLVPNAGAHASSEQGSRLRDANVRESGAATSNRGASAAYVSGVTSPKGTPVPPSDGAQPATRYPTKPIRVIVPYAPGGPTDILARAVGQALTDAWGQPVIVDNRPGASGNLGTAAAARAPADGYSLNMVAISFAVAPSLESKLGFDPVKDFAPITLVATVNNILVVHPSLPVKSVKELIALAKAKPGQLSYASGGAGGAQHLAGELFTTMAGIKMVHIPYKGSAPGLTALIGGEVTVGFTDMLITLPHVKSGKLRALAVTGAERSPQLPDLPTIAEAGLAGYSVTVWFGLLAPAATPPVIISRINGEIIKSLKTSQMKERLAALGADPVGNTPDQFAAFLKTEMSKWAKVVKAAGIRGE